MEFTTHLELHSQATRLYEIQSYGVCMVQITDGILTLYDALFQRTCIWPTPDKDSQQNISFNRLAKRLHH